MGSIIIVDAFWGDAGKGKFSAYLSVKNNATICVRAGIGPNAGHSVYIGNRVFKNRLIPLGFINPNTRLMIGSGVAVDPEIFLSEVESTHTKGRVFIDYRCPIIEGRHKIIEQNDSTMKLIDSLKTGAGAARADYIMRSCKRAKDLPNLLEYTTDVAKECNEAAKDSVVVVEGSQATFLSLYLSDRYPYTTSDNCTSAAFLDDVGLSWRTVQNVLLLVKCLPTSVGNGPLPNEMSIEEIVSCNLQEYGVISGRPRRRVRKIDEELLKYAVMINGATEIALTHCDQYDRQMEGCTSKDEITTNIINLKNMVEAATGAPVRYLETGKDFSNIIEL